MVSKVMGNSVVGEETQVRKVSPWNWGVSRRERWIEKRQERGERKERREGEREKVREKKKGYQHTSTLLQVMFVLEHLKRV